MQGAQSLGARERDQSLLATQHRRSASTLYMWFQTYPKPTGDYTNFSCNSEWYSWTERGVRRSHDGSKQLLQSLEGLRSENEELRRQLEAERANKKSRGPL
jgi:hypothetical protein